MKSVLALLTALVLTGCAHAYACKGFPQFSACKSATQAYRSTNKAGLPESSSEPFHEEAERTFVPSRSSLEDSSHHAERSPAQTLKIWQAPYEDDQGDLIGSSTILTEVEPRRWHLGHAQAPVPRRLVPLQVANAQRTPAVTEDRGGFPLFATSQGPRRLHVEEVDYREP